MTTGRPLVGALASAIIILVLATLATSWPRSTGRVEAEAGAASGAPAGMQLPFTTTPARGQDPPAASDPARSTGSPAPSDPSSLALTPEERAGQDVQGSRFGRCTGISAQYDELVDIEYVATVVDLVVLAAVDEVGGTFYATSDHSVPDGDATEADVYRPTIVFVERVLGGKLADTDGSFTTPGAALKVRVVGGRIGCDEYSSSRVDALIEPGQRWVLFLDNLPTRDGKPARAPTVIRTWKVTADGRVVTAGGDPVTVQEFERRAAGKPA